MSANCPECKWVGSYQQVVDGGYCPTCYPVLIKVRYDSIELPDPRIKTVEQFNRRAVKALQACGLNEWDAGFVKSIEFRVEHYDALKENEQRNLLRAVMRRSREIGDRPVIDYAEMHAPRLTA